MFGRIEAAQTPLLIVSCQCVYGCVCALRCQPAGLLVGRAVRWRPLSSPGLAAPPAGRAHVRSAQSIQLLVILLVFLVLMSVLLEARGVGNP